MARLPRIVVPDYPHHITQRGNARRTIFHSVADRQVYLGLLRQYAGIHSLRILGYCLMTNHVHLVVDPVREDSLPKAMKDLNGRYAAYKNTVEQTTGHVWQNRYFSCVFEPARLGSVMRYVEMNPVRAGLVQSPEDYMWSSAVAHLGGPDHTRILDGTRWNQQWPMADWSLVLREASEEAASIREATHTGRPLGSRFFIVDLEHRLVRPLAVRKGGRPRKDRQAAAA